MSTKQDMEFSFSEDWLVDFEVVDADGDVIDITGATIRFRLSTIAGVTVMTRTESDGITITSGTNGMGSLRVTPAQQTSAGVIGSTIYQWEMGLTTAGGIVSRHGYGFINVKPSLLAA